VLVCKRITADPLVYGYFGAMTCDYANAILQRIYKKNLLNNGEEKRKIRIEQIEQLMSLLTECRVQAGGKISRATFDSSIQFNVQYDKNLLSSDPNTRRILVIDDNVDSWRPVLEILQYELNESKAGALKYIYLKMPIFIQRLEMIDKKGECP